MFHVGYLLKFRKDPMCYIGRSRNVLHMEKSIEKKVRVKQTRFKVYVLYGTPNNQREMFHVEHSRKAKKKFHVEHSKSQEKSSTWNIEEQEKSTRWNIERSKEMFHVEHSRKAEKKFHVEHSKDQEKSSTWNTEEQEKSPT